MLVEGEEVVPREPEQLANSRRTYSYLLMTNNSLGYLYLNHRGLWACYRWRIE